MSQAIYLSETQLCERWGGQIQVQTLRNWRNTGKGPAFHKFGGRVLYSLEDVRCYETESRRHFSIPD